MADVEDVDTDETWAPYAEKGVAYISGPMRSKPEFNYPYFNQVEDRLTDEGWQVLNPARHFDGDTSKDFADYMEKDYLDVIAADTVFLLPGWQDSEGARLEVQVAKSLGKSFQLVDEASATLPAELEAASLVRNGNRQAAYGHPSQDFERTAKIWEGILGVDISTLQVALCMAGLKISRLVGTPRHRDSLVDAHGYFTCYERIIDSMGGGE